MKKIIFTVALALGATTLFGQDLTSKKGENYLPEEGDWAIGIDAVPMLNYLGNFFGKSNDNMNAGNIWNASTPGLVLKGKYFHTENVALRAGLNIGANSVSQKVEVATRGVAAGPSVWPDLDDAVTNKWTSSAWNVGLNAGMEWRKGNTRLQGFYGGEIGFMVGSASNKFKYGNDLEAGKVWVDGDDDFSAMGASNIGSTVDAMGNTQTTRVLSSKQGVSFGLGVRGFIGAEYFIIPKLSIGGELGWGIGLAINGKSSTVSETVGFKDGASAETVEQITRKGSSSSMQFGLSNDIVNPLFGPVGSLNLTFHF